MNAITTQTPPDQRQAPLLPPAAILPGAYMRMRREAAAIDLGKVALMLGSNPGERATALAELRALEANEPGDFGLLINSLGAARAFPFDPFVYFALVGVAANPAMPAPQVCSGCACSWHDACEHDALGPCFWTRADLCSSCEWKEAGHAA